MAHLPANVANYPPALSGAGLYFSQAIIWVKEHPVLTRKDYWNSPKAYGEASCLL